jgi:hypothetical protein
VSPRPGDERPPAKIELDYTLLTRLRAEAVKRDMPVGALIRDLLDAIVADKLTAAILD